MDISLIALFTSMGGFAKGIVFALAIMSVYSLTIMVGSGGRCARRRPRRASSRPSSRSSSRKTTSTRRSSLAESYKKSHVARVLGGALGEVKPLHPGWLRHGRRHQLGRARGRAQHADHSSPS